MSIGRIKTPGILERHADQSGRRYQLMGDRLYNFWGRNFWTFDKLSVVRSSPKITS